MGTCNSSIAPFVPRESIRGQDQISFQGLEKLALTAQNISEIYVIFNKMDRKSTGYIVADSVPADLGLDNTEFNKKLFHIFDYDNTGKINFFQFTCVVS
jgi:Ca2+-binding EF-hand superfamily protein